MLEGGTGEGGVTDAHPWSGDGAWPLGTQVLRPQKNGYLRFHQPSMCE